MLCIYRLVTARYDSEDYDLDSKEVRESLSIEAEVQKTFRENPMSFQKVAQLTMIISSCFPIYIEN